MSLNPITAIEKLINEHGSAVILRERLLLAADEFNALDRKTTELALKVSQLEAENKALRFELQQRAAQMHALEVAAEKKQANQGKPRPGPEVQIMMLLTNGQELTVTEIAERMGIGRDLAEVHLLSLYDDDMANRRQYSNYGVVPKKPDRWYLFPNGKKYLAQHGLIT